ncbi:MAG TPA: hydroxyacid dehydrogenase, partial [Candidatus Yonathbacteria bacterium]|nr:hydroxyacid dehydrogenase [Candidatus Yonathbacteria bacterium]
MKVLYFLGEEWEEEYVEEKLDGVDVEIFSGPIQDYPDLHDDEVEVLSVFIKSHVGAEEMDKFPNIKLIATRSTGFDHIDLEEAKKRGIIVSNVPSYGANTVAEYAFALLLSLSRKIPESYEQVRETGSFSQKGLRGFDLKGKTLGVVGCGNIGVHAIIMGKGFGMEVIVSDPHQNEEVRAELGFKYVSLDELLASSDIITIHAPYNEHTHHLINSENINKIKRGAYLINTARGAIIETEALIRGLKEGI